MLSALILAISFLPALHASMSCMQTVNGTPYNLTAIHGLGDIFINSFNPYAYYINVCGAVQAVPCASRPSAFVCQIRKTRADRVEAVLAYSDIENHTPAPIWTPSTSTYGGVTLTFTNGDRCNLGQRITIIDFQCDINGTRFITIDENPQCTYNVIFPTKHTCIASPSSSSNSSSASHTNTSTSSTGSSPSNPSSTAATTSTGPSILSSTAATSSTGPSILSSSMIPSPTPTNSSTSIPSNSSTSIPSNSSTSIPTNSSTSIIPTNSSTSIPTNSSTSIPSNSSSTTIFSSSSIPSFQSSSSRPTISSTGTIPSTNNEQSSTVTITGAGIGIGVLIGTSVTSAIVLIWCCWDRSRRRSTAALNINERQYATLDA